PMKSVTTGDVTTRVAKADNELVEEDFKLLSSNSRAMSILINSLSPSEAHAVSSCKSAKEIWEAHELKHEGTSRVKKSKINNYLRAFEMFKMESNESITIMDSRFNQIVNA
ncbi:UNVERIFIED_CONTAM: hypothetical protein ITH36_24970, partial [Salmonella enterica subsp. enterica serovar Weltevreden]